MTETKSSKSLLPLIEIIIALTIFTIAAIITMQLFFLARFMGFKTQDRARAAIEVQNIAEEIKSKDSVAEIEAIIEKWQESTDENVRYINFNGEWGVLEPTDVLSSYAPLNIEYKIKVTITKEKAADGYLYGFDFNVYKIAPYPFVDDKYKDMNYEDRPLTENIQVKKFASE